MTTQTARFVNIGERTNVAGSPQFAKLVRAGNLAVLHGFSEEDWRRLGTANGQPISVRALAFIMAGHVNHHLALLGERYGLGTETLPD